MKTMKEIAESIVAQSRNNNNSPFKDIDFGTALHATSASCRDDVLHLLKSIQNIIIQT